MRATHPARAGRLVVFPVFACMILAVACGCQIAPPFLASSLAPDVERSAARESKPAPRTIALEVLFVRFSADEIDTETSLWTAVDEQSLDARVRGELAANGLRAGILPATLPGPIQQRLDAASFDTEASGEPLPSSHKGLSKRMLRLLPGKESRLVARAGLGELVVFEHAADGVHGRTFHDATSGMLLSAWPAADGRSRLTAIPAVEHGPQRRTWTGEEGIFRLENGQARHAFDALRIETELAPEMMLAVGAIPGAESSVGSALFRDPATGDRRIFVIRPISRTKDPMFQALGEDGEAVPAVDPSTGR